MDKRYQVFISSTYTDLQEERRAVIQAVIEANCIPAGMELFPAGNEQQLEFIKRVIDDCDYYLLIIGGRYGSVTSEGISYTEREFDYAVSRKLWVMAHIHGNPEEIPFGKSEKDPALRERLDKFKQKVSANRIVKSWTKATDLPGQVALSLLNAIREHPAVGWIRASRAANEDVLAEINDLRKKNAELGKKLETALTAIPKEPAITDLAGLDEKFTVEGKARYGNHWGPWETSVTWEEIFFHISPFLESHPNESVVRSVLAQALKSGGEVIIDTQSFKTIGLQLRTIGLVEIVYTKTTAGGMGLFWLPTPAGNALMLKLRTVRSAKGTK